MVKLKYNLDEISTSAYHEGRVRAKVKSVKKQNSKAGNPMLVFEWVILTGPDKKKKIKTYPSLLPDSLGNLKEHLEALGESGSVSLSSDKLIGRIAVLVITEQPSTKDGGRPFVGPSRVLPKSAPLVEEDDEDEDEEDDEEEFDEDEDDDEEDDDDDDEDWDEDDDD